VRRRQKHGRKSRVGFSFNSDRLPPQCELHAGFGESWTSSANGRASGGGGNLNRNDSAATIVGTDAGDDPALPGACGAASSVGRVLLRPVSRADLRGSKNLRPYKTALVSVSLMIRGNCVCHGYAMVSPASGPTPGGSVAGQPNLNPATKGA